MKWLFGIVVSLQLCFANEHIEFRGDIGIKTISYNDNKNDLLSVGKSIVTFKKELFELHTEVDFFYSQKYKDKKEVYFNELYMTWHDDMYAIKIGKQLTFWGELEGYNITDVINPKNSMLDIFDKSEKKGVWALMVNAFEENKNVELGIKVHEEDNKYVDDTSSYYFLPLAYTSNLQIKNRYSPTVYLKYSFLTDESIESESSIIIQKGYDNKRYFAPISEHKMAQFAYNANKVMFLSNILYQDIFFKFEAAYTDVLDESKMSDYRQLGVGFEKGFYDINGIDITLYTEYYYYDYLNNDKPKYVDISELYDNDIFMALRFTLNDTRDSELKLGFLKDIKNGENITKVEIKSRLADTMVFIAEGLHFSKQFKTYSKLTNHTRMIFGIKYFF
ncbi:MAG: hypothetical protein LGB68_02485 [Sulfurovum sp.]|nr:hypothetical protein [Sulfurovum sp.]MCB4749701.1 hypothetical protein [Sulfurovum sp.]MCB4753391.1 hypothetical protein [Sulfurovum sp.]MCB4759977.1 hypothetical protein [Sulfurovum sp.]MCB4761920.1 hypothetical protein [Sulfurovum sp.]